MFGLFGKKAAAKQQGPAAGERPAPPRLEGLVSPQDATDRQIVAALDWAREWTKEPEVDLATLQPMLRATLAGAGFPRKAFAGRLTLDMALRAINLAAQRNRGTRSARSEAYALFLLGPQEAPCQAAQAMERRIVLLQDLPTIPLPGCDKSDCRCGFRQLTRREVDDLR